jgi:branched-chain amino acid transport system substrate-binding protein
MKKLCYFISFLSLFSCATNTTLIETRHGRINPKNNGANIDSPSLPVNSSSNNAVITTEALQTDPVVPLERVPVPLAPTNLNFITPPKKEPPAKVRSGEDFAVDSKKVGAILPLTGRYAHIGQRALLSLRLGLGLTESSPKLSLAIYDSQSEPSLAAAGVEKLLKNDQVIALFGGLGAKEAVAISERAEFFQIPFFAFSQKSGLTEESDYTFRNAMTAEMQMDQLANFSFEKLLIRKYAILYPNDAYGVEFANKFWDQVLARGGTVTAAQAYDPKNTNFNSYVQKMVGIFYNEDRPQEYRAKLKELKEKLAQKKSQLTKKNSREKEDSNENLLEPIVNFDAIFIPDSSRALGQAMAFFKSNDVKNLTYLGTNLWNTPDLIRRAGGQNQNIFFVDTNSAAAENSNTEFYKKYFALNQQEPRFLDAQTYEAAKIIRELLSYGASGRESLASQLRILGRRNGAYQEIRMSNSREIERDLTIMTTDQGSIRKY